MGVPGQVDDLSALETAEVAFTGADGETVNGYLAAPAGGEGNPGLIVIHEAMGLNEHIRDVARRFAAQGYTAMMAGKRRVVGGGSATRAQYFAGMVLPDVVKAAVHSLMAKPQRPAA